MSETDEFMRLATSASERVADNVITDKGDLVTLSPPASNGKRRKSAAEIFAIDDIRQEDVYVPEWDTYILIRGLTGAGRDHYEHSIMQGKGANQSINAINARAKLVRLTAIYPDGTPMFSAAQVGEIGKKSAAVIQRLFDVARRLSGLSDDDMDELTEGFEVAQVTDSHSV